MPAAVPCFDVCLAAAVKPLLPFAPVPRPDQSRSAQKKDGVYAPLPNYGQLALNRRAIAQSPASASQTLQIRQCICLLGEILITCHLPELHVNINEAKRLSRPLRILSRRQGMSEGAARVLRDLERQCAPPKTAKSSAPRVDPVRPASLSNTLYI